VIPERVDASGVRAGGGDSHSSSLVAETDAGLAVDWSDLAEFHRRREAVLARLHVSRDAQQAAQDLADQLGGKVFAYRWARALFEATR
jgi:hypothetical protein